MVTNAGALGAKPDMKNHDAWEQDGGECKESADEVGAWSKEEAETWRQLQPPEASVRYVLLVQACVSVLVGLIGVYWGYQAFVSAMYGGFCVFLPTLLMAWRLGYLRGDASQGLTPALQFGRFFIWEGVKILLSILMLVLAPLVLTSVNWLALLAGLVFSMKSYWLALMLRRGAK